MVKFRVTSNKVEGRYYDMKKDSLEEALDMAKTAFKSELITYVKIKRVE